METIFLLLENTDDQINEVLSWSDDRDKIEAEASAREWARYHDEKAQADQHKEWRVLSPDDTDYRCFTVQEVTRLP